MIHLQRLRVLLEQLFALNVEEVAYSIRLKFNTKPVDLMRAHMGIRVRNLMTIKAVPCSRALDFGICNEILFQKYP